MSTRTLACALALLVLLALTSFTTEAQVADPGPRFPMPAPRAPKSVTTARVLAIVPSAGHIYAGEAARGLAFLGGMAGVLAVGTLAVAGDCVGTTAASECGENDALGAIVTVAFFGVWGYSIYDAGLAARRTNARGRFSDASPMLSPAMLPAHRARDVLGFKAGIRLGLP